MPHLLSFLALAQVGAVSLPLDPAVPHERRRLAARKFGAAWVASSNRDLALPGLGFLNVDPSAYSGNSGADPEIHAAAPGDPVFIFQTSGTSGDPKGMVISHANIAARNRTTEPGDGAPARVLQMALSYFVGIGPALRALAHGNTLVIPARTDGKDVLHILLTQKVTHAYLTPNRASEIAGLVDANVRGACGDLISLRIVGEHLNERLREALRRLTPNVYVAYGSTEAGVVTLATPDLLARHPETVGEVCDWAEVEIVDAGGARVPAGVVGELRIRSSQLVDGYYLDEALTRMRFRDGWFYPGDRGHFDAEGLLYIEGRVDDMVNVAGSLVDAADIERVLAAHPLVVEAGAFAAASPDSRAMLCAALVLADPSKLAEVQAYAINELGALAPKGYVAVKTLPRTANGKLQRKLLTSTFPLRLS